MTMLPPRTPAAVHSAGGGAWSDGFAIWHGALPREACARAIAAMDLADAQPGRVLRRGEERHDAALRACTEHVLTPDAAAPVTAVLRQVAQAAYRGSPALLDGPRFCRYRQGGHFRAHRDRSHDSADSHAVRTRRLSLVCLLNDATPAFDGGALVLYLPAGHGGIRPVNAALAAGSVIAFSSDLLHEVRPVCRGTRYSAVAWLYDVPNEESNDAQSV